MDKVIIHDCPICGKSARTIDNKQEASSEDLVKCDGNEYYTCYRSASNAEWRYIARRSRKVEYKFGKND